MGQIITNRMCIRGDQESRHKLYHELEKNLINRANVSEPLVPYLGTEHVMILSVEQNPKELKIEFDSNGYPVLEWANNISKTYPVLYIGYCWERYPDCWGTSVFQDGKRQILFQNDGPFIPVICPFCENISLWNETVEDLGLN